ncbi:geranylgeranyl transferase type-1 subunit beta [Cladophialophora chaetospira]|uniref:Geranylgeranyl transferase type-1 subunit beta n=1 Tax=Cladophialophora chaetospira TaxID=386627 RepID=A0AA38X1V0_9EURO|nr:geranylgeranyl transferase type-1 subunit beta [Cladophialophora chaetospira]
MAPSEEYRLDKQRHIKYWKRCAQLLPEPYTSGDSSRMSFGFLIVAALDLLDVLDSVVDSIEKQSWIEWIYACQVPHTGGFRGFTGTMFGGQRSYHNWHWDTANLPNTYFALATLVMLGDDLARVNRSGCLAWVRSLQRPNGSFGEFSGENDEVEGADDPRHCMCAVGILNILQGDAVNGANFTINEQSLRKYIANCQSPEGGIGQAPLLEPHSGLNYCGIATLSFLGLLKHPAVSVEEMANQAEVDVASCTRWMLDRQTTWVEDDDDDDDDQDEDETPNVNQGQKIQPSSLVMSSLQGDLEHHGIIAGFCGRCGKIADTCYCFWNVGALAILQQHRLVDIVSLRSYLLGKVTHIIGGFGKGPGELPGTS